MISLDNRHSSPYPLLYAAPVSFYSIWIKEPGEFDIHENFTKQTYRSRTRVYGANGVISLSVPVQGGSQNNPMGEVKISNIAPWQRTHWRTLVSAYKSSPFFEFYGYLFEPLFTQKFDSLVDFNSAIHETILKCLQLQVQPRFTNSFYPIHKKDLRVLYSTKKPHPKALHFAEYQQVFSYQNKFEPDLSIFDTLFNLGPETLTYLDSLTDSLH